MIKGSLVQAFDREAAARFSDKGRANSYILFKSLDLSLSAFVIFSLMISLGFFWEGTKADFSSLTGDQINILTVAAKKDYPHLFEGDLVAGDSKNVDYYIPVFVGLVRFFSLPDHNYLRGLNILLLFTSVVYMLGWWLLFSYWGDKWVAGIMAFLVRGVMWPPGHELWGIAGLGSMLPRTLFLALLPWLLWLWFRHRQTRKGWLTAAFFCGLIVNIHPISGVCIVVALLFGDLAWSVAESRAFRDLLVRMCSGSILILVGMAPFVWTYMSMVGTAEGVDPNEFYQAIRMRIAPMFWTPELYMRSWIHPQWLIFAFVPYVLLPLARQNGKLGAYKKEIIALTGFSLGCVFAALAPFFVERILRSIGYEVRFAFQLVRTGKYLMVPSLILAVLVVVAVWRYIASHVKHRRAVMVAGTCFIFLLTLVSRHPVFDPVPFLGDDVSRLLWPTMGKPRPFDAPEEFGGILNWIKENTSENAKFVGPRLIRPAALRPVIYDFAGAGMLIEGNPRAFVEAARRKRQLAQPEYRDPIEKSKLIASWGADYWMTRKYEPELHLAHADAGWFIYDLRTSVIMK